MTTNASCRSCVLAVAVTFDATAQNQNAARPAAAAPTIVRHDQATRKARGQARASHRARRLAGRQFVRRLARPAGIGLSAAELRDATAAALSRAVSAARLHGLRRELVRFQRRALRQRAGCNRPRERRRRARVDHRNAERVHEVRRQHVLELRGDGRLGSVRREGSRGLRRQPLPHARETREPRPRRPLDGRLRHDSHRHEVPRCVLEPVFVEPMLHGREPRAIGRAVRRRAEGQDGRRHRGARADRLRHESDAGLAPPRGPRTRRIRRSTSTCRLPTARSRPTSSHVGSRTRRSRWCTSTFRTCANTLAIAVDAGDKDQPIESTVRTLDQILSSYGIAHTAETYGGDHVNHIDERLASKVLPFFSAHLAFE